MTEKDLDNQEEKVDEQDVQTETEVETEENNKTDEPSERENQLKDQLIRLQADFTNYKRRSENERQDYLMLGSQKVIGDLLVIVDNFERALAQVKEKDSFSEGIELIYNQLIDLLSKNNVQPINETDIKFDPNLHHAVLVEQKDGVEEGTVIDVLQKGYKIQDKILRPAMVKVSE